MLICCIFAILTTAVLGALYYGYRLAFYYQDPQADPMEYGRDDQTKAIEATLDAAIVDFQQAPWEDVSIRSQDGLTLTGRYYQTAQGRPLLIQMHGYKGNALRDFCGVWNIAQEQRYNVLLIDERCHGSSQGHTITFGIKEHQDCLRWVEYARQRFGEVPIVLMGVSMGAATVLMAANQDLSANVRGIVADCPYDSPANIIQKVLGVEMGMPVKLVYPLIRLGGRLYGGFDLESHSPLAAVSQAKVPILLIHGDDDRFVPYSMSCNLKNAAPEKIEFRTIPGSGHAMNQVKDPQLYRSILVPFLEKHLGLTGGNMSRLTKAELTNLCLICDGDRVLVQEKAGAGGLVFPGGHVEAGESVLDSVIREMKEETGLTIRSPKLCGIKDWCEEDGSRYLVFLYRADQFEGELRSSQEGRVFWLDRSALTSANLIWNMRDLLEIFAGDRYSEFFYRFTDGAYIGELLG